MKSTNKIITYIRKKLTAVLQKISKANYEAQLCEEPLEAEKERVRRQIYYRGWYL